MSGSTRTKAVLLFALWFGLSATELRASGPEAVLRNEDVISLSRVGIADDVIVLKIETMSTAFRTAPGDLVFLKKNGLSDRVFGRRADSLSTHRQQRRQR
jgi:hypothetical protein